MSALSILTPSDASDLENKGLLGPRTGRGTRLIHNRRLNAQADNEYQHISLDTPLTSLNAFTEFPEFLISYATLIHVGFTDRRATNIWEKWTNWPSTGPSREIDPPRGNPQVTFFDFIIGRFSGLPDTWTDNDPNWLTLLSGYGLNHETQLAIMDPMFKYTRLTMSCLDWAKDTIRMRFEALRDMQRASRLRDSGLINLVSLTGPASFGIQTRNAHTRAESSQTGQGSLGGGSSASSRGGRLNRSSSSVQRDGTRGVAAGSSRSASAIAARNAPGFTILFKGVEQHRVANLLNVNGQIDRISPLRSWAPTDFSGHGELYYFTPDYKVAERYAAFAKRRGHNLAVCIVSIAIPNSAIEQMDSPELLRTFWPSPEWKELIWTCRRGQIHPRHLRKYKLATIVIGTISSRPNALYETMQSPAGITSDFVLKVDDMNPNSAPATQFVFSAEEGEEFFREHVGRNIRVTPFTRSDLEEWVNDFRRSLS
ncbi:hypothetical protein CTAM01_05618 [Colletotrichum tamarilloi]|uniref:Uncharacterized protein n=1 Tax=Colletotrichum tamarilloi TaxID=1209934 RepID=A0ABQ9RF52_9PEZI|nr:uncharacterized protein CTAM01_05618 [Colletotrichum tamarilloi]KAK1502180.1 hypothetical protein CTAM01_05618 [Colletotrichum tamarilloi]